jgi:hypothetical protein
MTARIASSVAICAAASFNPTSIARDRALCFSGRASHNVAMPRASTSSRI